MTKQIIRIATRKSLLALWQANTVKDALQKRYSDISVALVEIVTEGDKTQDIPLQSVGGKGLFVKALQHALLNDEADIAVHSVKDMSVQPVAGLQLSAFLKRGDVRDVLVSRYSSLSELPSKAVIGTSSPRRAALVQHFRDDCVVSFIRGNVDTRLAKVDRGEYDAIILAAAGLERLGLQHRITEYFDPLIFTPAIGQGAIGIECRENDDFIREKIAFLNDTDTEICVRAEQTVNQIFGGDCHTAIGAYAFIEKDFQLNAMFADEKRGIILRANAGGSPANASMIATQVANHLLTPS